MSQQSNIDLAIFNDVPGQDALEILFNLNQENVPEILRSFLQRKTGG